MSWQHAKQPVSEHHGSKWIGLLLYRLRRRKKKKKKKKKGKKKTRLSSAKPESKKRISWGLIILYVLGALNNKE